MVAEYSSIGASWNVRILIDLLEGIACLLATHDTHILPHACVGGQKMEGLRQLVLLLLVFIDEGLKVFRDYQLINPAQTLNL